MLHLIFRQLSLEKLDNPGYEWYLEPSRVSDLTESTLARVVGIVESDFPGYLVSLFKNATKSGRLAEQAMAEIAADFK